VSGSYDKTVRLWDAVTGAALQTLEGHSGSVTSVTFSPDGKQVVSGSYDGTVWLWDAVTGAALKTLDGHSGNVYSMNSKQENTLFVSKNWIIESGTKILWLPFEYRHPSCTAVWNQSLALGYSSGEVIIIGFEEGLKVI
jgi:WD40 repeat protein